MALTQKGIQGHQNSCHLRIKGLKNGVNQFKPDDNLPRYDLGALLKENPNLCRVLRIHRANTDYLKLDLIVRAKFDFGSFAQSAFIDCVNAVDYSIRPVSRNYVKVCMR